MEIIHKIVKTPVIEEEYEERNYPYFVMDFINKMKDRNLSMFYHNIKDASYIETDNKNFHIINAGAEYEMFSNKIQYNIETVDDEIMHELYHMSTRIKTKKRVIVGFMQVNYKGFGIGCALNEGYTSSMDDRYFMDYTPNKKKQSDNIYPVSKYFCRLLDSLLSQDHMEELYMHADLYTLFKELSILTSPRKTYLFLSQWDKLSDLIEYQECLEHRLTAFKLYNDIILYFAECYMTMYKIQLETKLISQEEYNQIMSFIYKGVMGIPLQLQGSKVIKSRKMNKYFDVLKDKVDSKFIKSRVK